MSSGVKTRKFSSTTKDANGNLHANGVGSAITSADLEDLAMTTMRNTIDSLQTERNNTVPQGMMKSIGVQSALDRAANKVKGTMPGGGSTMTISENVTKGLPMAKNSYSEQLEARLAQRPQTRTSIPNFNPSKDTDRYQRQLRIYESEKPDPFESRYDGQIQNILNGILNREQFNLKDDVNYNMLYDQARESYMNAGNRAMRDTMGAMQAATGGYGSTAALAAGSQAYDNYLQAMNDNNQALAQMAYGMYQDETADRYNQLGALEGLDQVDYGRYRDDYNDWFNDRNYYANQYDKFYNNDWNRYQYGTNMQYQMDRDRMSDYENALAMDYKLSRDALSDYDEAYSKAMSLAQQGLAVPQRYRQFLDDDTLNMLNGLAAQVVMGSGSGGGGGSRRGRGSGSSSSSDTETNSVDLVDVMNFARNTGASQDELDDIYKDMTMEERARYNLQLPRDYRVKGKSTSSTSANLPTKSSGRGGGKSTTNKSVGGGVHGGSGRRI